jgi:DNA-binding CsgD family transcriptional regulator
MSNLIKDVVIPFLQILARSEQVVVLCDNNGKILYASDEWKIYICGDKNRDVVGRTLHEISPAPKTQTEAVISVHKIVVEKRSPISCIVISDSFYHVQKSSNFDHHVIVETDIFPVVDEQNNVIATYAISKEFYDFNLFYVAYFKLGHSLTLDIVDEEILFTKLSRRELEILYLLINGLSQSEIAGCLNISRGAVAKIISSRISEKLGVNKVSQALIIQKAISLKLHQKVPISLLEYGIIVVDGQNISFVPS